MDVPIWAFMEIVSVSPAFSFQMDWFLNFTAFKWKVLSFRLHVNLCEYTAGGSFKSKIRKLATGMNSFSQLSSVTRITSLMSDKTQSTPRFKGRNILIIYMNVTINLPLFSTVLPSKSCCFCPVGLLLLIQHFQRPQDLLKMLY